MPRRRANRVTEQRAALVALAAGVPGAVSPAAPTGHGVIDALIVAAAIAAVTYAAASAPWWAIVVAAGAALTVAVDPALTALGVVALAGGLWVGTQRHHVPVVRAGAAGLAANVLARAELDGFFGLTTIVGVGAGALLLVLGLRRRPGRIRRVALVAAGMLGALVVLAGVGFGLSVAEARADLRQGRDVAEGAIDALNDGDFAVAAERFGVAAAALARADRDLARPWALGAAVVPVVAQHRHAAAELSGAGARAAAVLADALIEIDPASVVTPEGRVDLAAVAALRPPFGDVQAALDDIEAALDSARSPWLVAPVREPLDSLAADVAANAPRLDNAVTAVDLAPRLLGGDGPRVYLVLFTTPAEARGLGGFVGNFAELTISEGRIDMTDFGRVSDLEEAVLAAGGRLSGPAEFLERYGRFGFDADADGGGVVGDASFRNLTMTPHFPWVGDVAAQLYPKAGGRPVDGVLALDPFVVAELLNYTGPIELPTAGRVLTADNAARYLLLDQYVEGADDNEERIDALEEAAELTFDVLLDGGNFPDPVTLARDVGPLVEERRLMIWSPHEEEQALYNAAGMAGGIPAHDGADGWSVAVTNGSGNKIDTFLRRAASYRSTIDRQTGETRATLHVELTNTAPAAGLPGYVIGNAVGLPTGWSRLYVSIYSPLGLAGVVVDGEPGGAEAEEEVGWNVYSRFVDIAPGATAVFDVSLAGALARPDGDLVTWVQPMVEPLRTIVAADGE